MLAGENVEPNGHIKGTIETVDGLYKVTFVHEGFDYVLGLFSTVDEAHRVCDVLNIKEAVDARRNLQALRLHFSLERYGVDNDTAGEIRSVSFRQVVRDLQVCAVHPINGAIGPEETQASSWAYAGATGILTSGTRFTDAVEHQPGEGAEGADRPHGAASAAGPRGGGARQGAARPPRRHARLQNGRSAGVSPSAARAAFTAAGIANAAAAVEHPPPPVSPAIARPLHPPPKFGDAAGQQGEQARQAERAEQGEQQRQASETLPSEAQLREQQEWEEQQGGMGGKDQQMADSQGQQQQQQQQQQQARGPAAAAAPADGSRSGGSPSAGAKRLLREPSAGLAQRPWQEQDVLAFTSADHPFHGITRLPDGCVAAQFVLKLSNGKPLEGGSESKVVRFAKCSTPAEAAAAWDVGSLWRAIQYGRDPASLDADVEPAQQLNFDYSRYADMLPQLRQLATHTELQAFVKSLRDNGTLTLLATNGKQQQQQQQGASPEAAAAAAPSEPGGGGGAARSPAATPALQPAVPAVPAVPAAAPFVRSLSGFLGVHGSGPWAAQLKVTVDKVVPDQQAAWTSRHSDKTLKVARCTSAELAAACHDLMLLWRCMLYGEDPSGPAGAALNYPLASLAAYQPALHSLSTDTVVPHILGLRDSGALQPLLATGRQASSPVVPAADAAPNAAPAAKGAVKRRPATAPAGRQAAAKRSAVGPASPQVQSVSVAATEADETPAAAAAAPAAAEAAAPAAEEAALAATEAVEPAAAIEEAPAAANAAAPAAETAGPAAAPCAQPHPSAAREAGQQGGQPYLALGELDAAAEMYPPDELPQVEAAEAAYAEVQARLEAVPQLSQMDVVAYMAHFMRLRDMRRLMHQQITSWSAAGKQALIVQHVRALLGKL
ncbi:hypothetical protein ABPG77_000111 [Micractinium sp. CCAP 211/92]